MIFTHFSRIPYPIEIWRGSPGNKPEDSAEYNVTAYRPRATEARTKTIAYLAGLICTAELKSDATYAIPSNAKLVQKYREGQRIFRDTILTQGYVVRLHWSCNVGKLVKRLWSCLFQFWVHVVDKRLTVEFTILLDQLRYCNVIGSCII